MIVNCSASSALGLIALITLGTWLALANRIGSNAFVLQELPLYAEVVRAAEREEELEAVRKAKESVAENRRKQLAEAKINEEIRELIDAIEKEGPTEMEEKRSKWNGRRSSPLLKIKELFLGPRDEKRRKVVRISACGN